MFDFVPLSSNISTVTHAAVSQRKHNYYYDNNLKITSKDEPFHRNQRMHAQQKHPKRSKKKMLKLLIQEQPQVQQQQQQQPELQSILESEFQILSQHHHKQDYQQHIEHEQIYNNAESIGDKDGFNCQQEHVQQNQYNQKKPSRSSSVDSCTSSYSMQSLDSMTFDQISIQSMLDDSISTSQIKLKLLKSNNNNIHNHNNNNSKSKSMFSSSLAQNITLICDSNKKSTLNASSSGQQQQQAPFCLPPSPLRSCFKSKSVNPVNFMSVTAGTDSSDTDQGLLCSATGKGKSKNGEKPHRRASFSDLMSDTFQKKKQNTLEKLSKIKFKLGSDNTTDNLSRSKNSNFNKNDYNKSNNKKYCKKQQPQQQKRLTWSPETVFNEERPTLIEQLNTIIDILDNVKQKVKKHGLLGFKNIPVDVHARGYEYGGNSNGNGYDYTLKDIVNNVSTIKDMDSFVSTLTEKSEIESFQTYLRTFGFFLQRKHACQMLLDNALIRKQTFKAREANIRFSHHYGAVLYKTHPTL